MKLLISVLALAGLGGCAAYDDGYYTAQTTTTYYTTPAPVYGTYYGGTTYYVPQAQVYRGRPGDRDGDGVPNWRDRDPNDPRYH